MAERLVAADASPLIGLAAAGAFDLLHRLFSRVVVTEAVRDEVIAGGDLPVGNELAAALEAGWIEVHPTRRTWTDTPSWDRGKRAHSCSQSSGAVNVSC